jgi:hypothetical protein
MSYKACPAESCANWNTAGAAITVNEVGIG